MTTITVKPLGDGIEIVELAASSGRSTAIGGTALDKVRDYLQARRDEKLYRWRSPDYPDHPVYPVDDNEVRVLSEHSLDTYIVQRDIGPSLFTPYAAAHAYFEAHPAVLPLPTEPGIYAPRKNLARLGQTNTYRLNEDGGWSEAFGGREKRDARDKALHAHTNLGGLVRLVPEVTA
ncbi:hypothetical protein K8F61_17270 [Microbacterium resistens]|uniref:Uncharacterized protein n=1 Tax=Microbacterium resistens TaxID=156977 RepID=A0ABY3RTX2_9MICO|nr:hypothetical protein [Microbacterium resistens]UGS26355.1 hypothetical protein K8F61_17270 [Microbacterium resistens]